jgi:Uma2 family endonuclease
MTEAAIAGRTRPWTVDDLIALPDDVQRYEIVEGSLVVSPPPSAAHQGVAARIAVLLRAALPSHLEALETTGIAVGDSVLVPDLTVAHSRAVWAGRAVLAAEDVELAVEVVSPSSVTADRITKPALYAAAGIPAYWRVELSGIGAPLIAVHRLAGDAYEQERVVRSGDTADLDFPASLTLRPSSLAGPRL